MLDKLKHKKDTISGIKWTILDQIISQTVVFGLGILLMKLISPLEFGLLAMVTVFSGFLTVFKDFGLGSSLIQKKEIQKKEIDTIYWTTVGLGLFLTILLIVLAPALIASSTILHKLSIGVRPASSQENSISSVY